MTKTYQCECGKILYSSQSFNGHRSACKVYLEACGKSFEQIMSRRNKSANRSRSENTRARKQAMLNQWIAEQHTCDKCGKVMTVKFGSGRFCSQPCANSHKKSNESKIKVSETLKKLSGQKAAKNSIKKKNQIEAYNKSPAKCVICSADLCFEDRYRQSCQNCYSELLSRRRKEKIAQDGYNLNVTVKSRYKYGWYKGIPCDSSWELAYVLYCLDRGLNIIRNTTDYFIYNLNDEFHKFYPDFIVNGEYVEIKGRVDEVSKAKVSCIPADVPFKIIYKSGIQKYLRYAEKTYGANFMELYDRSYPSWMDKVNQI